MSFNLDNIEPTATKDKEDFAIQDLLKKEIHLFGTTFSNKKKESFYMEISVLLQAGMPLKEVLVLLAEEYTKERERELIQTITNHIIAGHSFASSLKTNTAFTDYEYYTIKIGEETGTLAAVCSELGHFFNRKNEQRRNVIAAITYPIVILSTSVLAVAFMLRYVVPMFADIFRQNDVALPWLTKLLIQIADAFKLYSLWFVIFIIGLLIVRKMVSKKEWYQNYSTKIILKIPFIGKLHKKIYFAQFTQAIALLTEAKVPLQNSIQLVAKMIPFYPLQKALTQIEQDLISGNSLSKSMQKHKLFDKKMISLLRVAEETNQTAYIFDKLAKQYNDEIRYQSKQLSTVIEPFIILFLGVIVGTILVAMYLPMFKLSNILG